MRIEIRELDYGEIYLQIIYFLLYNDGKIDVVPMYFKFIKDVMEFNNDKDWIRFKEDERQFSKDIYQKSKLLKKYYNINKLIKDIPELIIL